MYYWTTHPFSTQYRKSIWKVIRNAETLFNLTFAETELLANKAGLSLSVHENGLSVVRESFNGSLKMLYSNAQISERMFRYYKTKEPTKQALQAIAISLNLSFYEINSLLHKYGYCFSKSMVSDMVVVWYLLSESYSYNGSAILDKINATLFEMELPLLMTRPYLY